MSQTILESLPLALAFALGLAAALSPGWIGRLRSGDSPGGSSSPPAEATAAGGVGQAYGTLAGLFAEHLRQAHAERTGTFVPSAVQKADIEKLATELLSKKLAELQSSLSPASPTS